MTEDATSFTRISEDALPALATGGLIGFGISRGEGEESCRGLVAADLFGIRTHTVSRVASYVEDLALGGITRAVDIRMSRTECVFDSEIDAAMTKEVVPARATAPLRDRDRLMATPIRNAIEIESWLVKAEDVHKLPFATDLIS
jgi:hypothetical protein